MNSSFSGGRRCTVTLFPDFARAGGLMAYGVNLLEMYRQAGVMVAKVLQGRKPAEIRGQADSRPKRDRP